MEKSLRRQQLVRAIQEFAAQEGMGAADVLRRVSERNCDVSASTIRRILKADAEKENFSVEVLQRLSAALFDIDAAPIPVEDIGSSEEAEREALKVMSAMQGSALQDANIELASAEKRLEDAELKLAQMQKQLAEAEAKIAELTDLADFRRQQMVEKDRQMSRLLAIFDKK